MNGRYDGPVIDPHHHLWDLSLQRHPWLQAIPAAPVDGAQPVFRGSNTLGHDYLVADYWRDAARTGIVATVHVEAGWTDEDPLGETRWLDGLGPSGGVARRYVARVALNRPDAALLLEAAAAHQKVAGIRDIVSWHPDPAKSFAPAPNLMTDPSWRAGLQAASRLGLVFDLMLYPQQMAEALTLVTDFPNTLFVLNHGGSPIERDADGMALWAGGIAALGKADNVRIKISDLVAYDTSWTLASLRPVILHCIDCFGPERAMFASDFPVAGLHASFDEIYDVFCTVAAEFSPDEQEQLFFEVANTTYGLGLASRAHPRKDLPPCPH